MPEELPVPDVAAVTADSVELLRVWIVGEEFVCSFPSDTDPDGKAWGEILAEVVLHVADKISGGDPHVIDPNVLAAMREQLELRTGIYQLESHLGRLGQHHNIVTMFHSESDRAAAILAAAYVDTSLEQALSDFLVDHDSVRQLFSKFGPLSTFASRIDMAFAMGLLAVEVKRDLNLIRKIRNHFAHHSGEARFDLPPVNQYCQQLTTARTIKDDDGSDYQIGATPRLQYLFAANVAVLRVGETIEIQRKRTLAPSVPLSVTKVPKPPDNGGQSPAK